MQNVRQSNGITAVIQNIQLPQEIQTELIRKTIHILIALVPMLAAIHSAVTLSLLASGILIYTYAELMRLRGVKVVLISGITSMAARQRDRGKFVMGPVTLGIGAMMALMLYPNPAASIAIYALAFGDGLSSVIGKLFGQIEMPFTGGKTVEGSLACFVAVFFISFQISNSVSYSLLIAAGTTLLEAMPLKDLDNIVIPAGTGILATYLLI
ncbi:MAG: diacylglycerol/polyprenol kinase family protein [Spirochaetia bacterium]